MKDFKRKSGCWRIGCLVLVVVPVLIAVAVFFYFRSSHVLPEKFVLSVPLQGTLDEVHSRNASLPVLSSTEPLSFQDLLFLFDRAAADKRVGSVLLEIGGLHANPAKLTELRHSIEKVRASGKKVVAFLRSAEDSDYLLATACDSIVVEEGGFLMLDGLKAETLFYTTALNKIGVTFQASQWKTYKSGIEPFVRTEASPEYLEQIGALLDDVYDDYLGYASNRRGISRDSLQAVIDNVALLSAKKAVQLGFADGIASSWALNRSLARKITGKEPERGDEVILSAERYLDLVEPALNVEGRDAIALITLSGPIYRSGGASGMSVGDGIDEKLLQSSLEAALDDRDVKALVLRIDSPGGDALASADMLEMLDFAAKKKPLVVSMSGVAASGGYMAALAGKKIFAEQLTITGSIGVYALKPEISGLVEKTGLQRSVVTRGRYADATSLFKPLDKDAYGKFVAASGDVYHDFVSKVAISRKMRWAEADSVAGGRVWSGKRALQAGLIDSIGGLHDAIRAAQILGKTDKTKKTRILFYPERKSWMESLVEGDFSGFSRSMTSALKQRLIHELVPEGQISSIAAFYNMLMVSGQLHLIAALPGEVVIR
ncbi:MAG: signal peptide peptidase SppA [Chlorobiaceae bacterium]|nr:signal peptide peptidase SppA [Chlorobiaceae bacterium]